MVCRARSRSRRGQGFERIAQLSKLPDLDVRGASESSVELAARASAFPTVRCCIDGESNAKHVGRRQVSVKMRGESSFWLPTPPQCSGHLACDRPRTSQQHLDVICKTF